MKLNISHTSTYTYEEPVELNPHTVFLKPLQRPYLEVTDYQLKISPSPEGQVERSSIEGNPFILAWFKGATDKLEIKVSFEVLMRSFDPFSFIIDLDFVNNINPSSDKYFHYDPKDMPLLYPYLLTEAAGPLEEFARQAFLNFPQNPIAYLMHITGEVHSRWSHIIREEENLWSPEKTFQEQAGSCRDLSWMLMHMLRMQGLATRFVSGYAYNPELDEGHELHAWVEVYLPGGGWTGIDPSLGLFTNENYIPLACSSEAHSTLPIHGNYGGTARATLSTLVKISQVAY